MRPEIQAALKSRSQSLAGKTALVTGASSGIGLATAVRLALEGCHLRLVARRTDRLAALRQELLNLNPQISVQTFALDLTEPDSIRILEDKGACAVDILLNNAGLARGLSTISDAQLAEWQEMINTNITAAFQVSRSVAKEMREKDGGDIVALSSVAAHVAYENGAVYCATKHAVRAFHEALRLETLPHNIRVMMISPGMVETEFSLVRFNGDSHRAKKVYEGLTPLDAGDIAENILFALKLPPHINIDDLILKPRQQGNPWKVHRESQ